MIINNFLKIIPQRTIDKVYCVVDTTQTKKLLEKGFIPVYFDKETNKSYFRKTEEIIYILKGE